MPISISPTAIAEFSGLDWVAVGPGSDPAVRLTASIAINDKCFQISAHRIKKAGTLGIEYDPNFTDKLYDLLWDVPAWRQWLEDWVSLPDDASEGPEEPDDPEGKLCRNLIDMHKNLVRFFGRDEGDQPPIWERDGQPYLLFGWVVPGAQQPTLPQVIIKVDSPELAWSNEWNDGQRSWLVKVEGCPVMVNGCPDITEEPHDPRSVDQRKSSLEYDRGIYDLVIGSRSLVDVPGIGKCSILAGPLPEDWSELHTRTVAGREEAAQQLAREPFHEAQIGCYSDEDLDDLAKAWQRLRDRRVANLAGIPILVDNTNHQIHDALHKAALHVRRHEGDGVSHLNASMFGSSAWLGRWGYIQVYPVTACLVDLISTEELIEAVTHRKAIPLPMELNLLGDTPFPPWVSSLPIQLQTSELEKFGDWFRDLF